MRTNMTQTKYVTEVSEFSKILLDDKLDNKNFQFINDDMVQMTYNFKDQTYTSHVSPQAMLD